MSSSVLTGPKNDKMYRDYSFSQYIINQDTIITKEETHFKTNTLPKLSWKTMNAFTCNTIHLEIEGDLEDVQKTEWRIPDVLIISSNKNFAIIESNDIEKIEVEAVLHYMTFSDTLKSTIPFKENHIDLNLNKENYRLDFEKISSLNEVVETYTYRGNKQWTLLSDDQSDNHYAGLVTEKEDFHTDSYLILPSMNLHYDGFFANLSLRYSVDKIPGSENLFSIEVYKHCSFDMGSPIHVLYTSKAHKNFKNDLRIVKLRNPEDELEWENLSVSIPKYILNEKDIHFVFRFQSKSGDQKVKIDDITISTVSDPFKDYYQKENFKFQIYPSPVIDYGTLNILSPKPNGHPYKVSIYDQQGNAVIPSTEYPDGSSIDFSGLRAGVYIAKIVDVITKSVGVEKVVKGN